MTFSDGTSVGVVDVHVFFDLTDRRFVAINSADQESELSGHEFAKLVAGSVELVSIREDGTTDSYYIPISEAYFNCFAEGMLSMSAFLKVAVDPKGEQDPVRSFNTCFFGGSFMKLFGGSIWNCQVAAHHGTQVARITKS